MGEGITKVQFTSVIMTLSGIFNQDNMKNRYAAEAFYRAISDLPYEAVVKAVDDYIREAKFPPTPADIREWADKYIEKPEPGPCDAAKAAYERWLKGEEDEDG